jgi:hypothetical protein
MATAAQRDRLRRDVDASETVLPDGLADDLFDEAGESYTDAASITAYTRIIFLQSLLASAAKMNDYRQNETEEKAGQIFAKVEKLLELWRGVLVDTVAGASGSAARFGKTKYIPARIREYPDL